MIEDWLAIFPVVAMLAFGIYCDSYLKRSKGCTDLRLNGPVLRINKTGCRVARGVEQ